MIVYAQSVSENDDTAVISDSIRTGIRQAVLPIVGFNSNFGLSAGGLYQRFDYGDGSRSPFVNMTKYRLIASTKDRFILKVDWELIDNFGPGTRSLFIFEGLRFNEGSFVGIGNDSKFLRSRFDEDQFFYKTRKMLLEYTLRKKITDFGQDGFLDVFASARLSVSKPASLGSDTELAITLPFGVDGGWINLLGFGFIADSRDNEFDPSKGIFFRTQASLSDNVFQSDFNFGTFSSDFRLFKELLNNVTLAQRIKFEHTTGSVPFFEKPSLGSEEDLRGFIDDRFFGDTSISHTTEIRTWILEKNIFGQGVRFGAQAFWDTGRVYSENDSNRLFDDWKHSYGGGIVYSVFTPDFIGRIDLGISNEISRLYFSAGYAF